MIKAVRTDELLVSPHNGPVAQLGARFHGMEEVVGSIPTRSTIILNGLALIAILIRQFLPVMLTCVAGTKPRKTSSISAASTKSPTVDSLDVSP